MSDTQSVQSSDLSSSAPIFSADDQNIELIDPDFVPISPDQHRNLPYLHEDEMKRAPIIQQHNSYPVLMDSSPNFLYSFVDSSENHAQTKSTKEITDSFGVSSQQYQSMLTKLRLQRSTSVASCADSNVDVPDGGSICSNPTLFIDQGSRDTIPTSFTTSPKDTTSTSPKYTTSVSPRDITPASPRDATSTSTRDTTPTSTRDTTPTSPKNTKPTCFVLSQRKMTGAIDSSPIDIDPEQVQLPVETSYSKLDSDIETASVVSVQHLTETYLSQPIEPLIDRLSPSGEREKIPFSFPTTVVSESLSLNETPEFIDYSQQKTSVSSTYSNRSTELLNPSRMPAHIHPQKPLVSTAVIHSPSSIYSDVSGKLLQNKQLPFVPVNVLRESEIPNAIVNLGEETTKMTGRSTENRRNDMKELQDKLAEEQRARVYLEGQLDSVKEECEAALKERPDILSKLCQVEAELTEMTSALEREKAKPKDDEHLKQLSKDLQDAAAALKQKEKTILELRNNLTDEKLKSGRLEKNLEDTKQTLDDQSTAFSELQDKHRNYKIEMDKKVEECKEKACSLSLLEASYGSLEKNKSWLHDHLQEAQKSKLKLQEELRETKTSGITQDIKCDQLQKENSFLQHQIADLQRGVLQDKAKMVSQLEAIEADVLSHEDLYTKLVAEKAQLEDMLKRKDDALSQVSSDLARMQVDQEELKEKLADTTVETNRLIHSANDLERENKILSVKLKDSQRDLVDRESDLKELEKMKNSFQEKLQQADTELRSKDGTIQNLKDAKELLQHELDLVNESKEKLGREMADTKCEVAKLEVDLRSTLDNSRKKDAQLKGILESQHSMDDEKQALHGLLAEKEEEIEQKEGAMRALEAQVNELLGEFSKLQDNFKSIASESGTVTDNIAEKDRVISHLAFEKDKSEDELQLLRKENQALHTLLGELQCDKAHLLGKLEGSINQEDFQKSLREKTQMQAELSALEMNQQHERIKSEAKVDKLVTDLHAAQKAVSQAQSELQRLKDERNEEIGKLSDAKYQTEVDLKEVRERLERALRDKEKTKGVLSLKLSNGQLEDLRAKNEILVKQNHDLSEQLLQETQQRLEVERASGLVATKLKQNAEQERNELMQKNRDISLELERLRGRLAGLHTTQLTMRDHASNLEIALAKKETLIVKLSTEAQEVLEKKHLERESFITQIAALEKQLKDEVTAEQEKVQIEKQRIQELESELSKYESNLASEQPDLYEQNSDSVLNVDEHIASLTLENDALKSDVSYLRSQLLVANTSTKSAKREIADKNSKLEILESELKIAKTRCQQADDEVKQLKEHLRTNEAKHYAEMEELCSTSQEKEKGVLDRRLDTASIATISGNDKTHQPNLTAFGECVCYQCNFAGFFFFFFFFWNNCWRGGGLGAYMCQ